MSTIASVHIEAPVERVFDYAWDPRNWQKLPHSGLGSVDVTFTKEGPGSYFDWTIRLGSLRLGGFDVVTDYVRNRHVTYKSSASYVGSWGYSVEPEGSGTKFTMEMHPRFIWAMPLLGPLWAEIMKREHEQVISDLKASLEAGLETRPAAAA